MRLAKWDNLKFFLIYCVVFGHLTASMSTDSLLLRGLYVFVYTFHMPAFLFVSGLFSKRAIDNRRIDKAAVYLILYLFMKIFRFLVYSILNGKASGFDLLSEGGVPWFALALCLYYLMTMAVNGFKKSYLLVVTVCVGMIAGYDSSLGNFLVGMRLLTFYPFFMAGYCMPIEKLTQLTEKRAVKAASFAVVAAVFCICFAYNSRIYGKMSFLKGKTAFEKMGMLPFGGIYRGIYYVAVMVLIICIIALIPSVNSPFAAFGGRTIQVFALHYPILRILLKVFHLKEHLQALWPAHYGLFVPIVAFLLTVVLSLPCFAPFFHWLMYPAKKHGANK